MKRSLLLQAVLLIFCFSAYAQDKVILSAMQDELTRTMGKLKLESEAGPYYVSYLLSDGYGLRIIADSGAITVNSENRNRRLKVDLRVGSYAQDNSNFLSLSNAAGLASSLSSVSIPLDDDYLVIRRQIWQATDRAYKAALDNLTKKKAALQNTLQTEILPDFSKGEATSSLTPENSFIVQRPVLTQLVEQICKMLLGQQSIQRSKIDLTVQIGNSYYINSEGATVIEPSSATRLLVSATAQADDGMPLNNFRIYTAARPEGLPEIAKLDADVKALISELLTARSAPTASEYNGPILFASQAAGELFSQGFGNLMAARRLPVSDSAQLNATLSRSENPFANKTGMKVAAGFLSLKAIPTQKNYGQSTLLGAYKIDEEGVPARDVSLIENGILKNLLTSRTPMKGMAQSNGHARGGAAVPSVLQVISANKKTYQQLKQELINSVKEEGLDFGYLVQGITPVSEAMSDSDSLESLLVSQQGSQESTQFRLTKPFSVFRIYADGKEEMVRGIEFGSINVNALRNVIATSDEEIVYSYPASGANLVSGLSGLINLLGSVGGSSQGVYTTVLTPALLIGGIDLKKPGASFPKLPIVSYPAK
jgi:predicted Zn-dependent protease